MTRPEREKRSGLCVSSLTLINICIMLLCRSSCGFHRKAFISRGFSMKTTQHKPGPSMGCNHGKIHPAQLILLALTVLLTLLIVNLLWNFNEPRLGRVYQIEKVDKDGFIASTVDLPGQAYEFKKHRVRFNRGSDISLMEAFSKDLVPGRYCIFWAEGSDNGLTLATTSDLKIAEAWSQGGPSASGPNFPEFYRWLENPIEWNKANKQ